MKRVWHHVAAVWDGSTLQAYIDGDPAGSAPFVGPPGYDSNPALIGADDNNADNAPDEGWNGLIDEVVIYDSALTPEEILARSSAPIHDCTASVPAEDRPSTGLLATSIQPNPARGFVEIGFHVLVAGSARVFIYDSGGHEVIDLMDGFASTGEHVIFWNGTAASGIPVASGVYFIRLEAGGNPSTGKLLFLR